MNVNYFNTNEKNGIELLTKLNDDVNFLKKHIKMPVKHCVDASGCTDLLNVLIEIKIRKEGICTYDDVYIESKKAAYLYFDWVVNGNIPIYLNGFKYGKNDEYPYRIAIWRLDKVKRYIYHPKTKTHSDGFEKDEYRERFGLYPKDAAIYELGSNGKYKMVKNIGEDWHESI